MRRSLRSVVLLLLVTAAFVPAANALASEPAEWHLIDSGPTEPVFGAETANPHALFSLQQPAWPNVNQCSLDHPGPQSAKVWTPCSFFFEASNLAVGAHLLDVRQVDPAGNELARDAFGWTVVAPTASTPIEAHVQCRQGYGSKPGSQVFPGGDKYTSYSDGSALYSSYVPGTAPVKTLPNTDSLWPGENPNDIFASNYAIGENNPTDFWSLALTSAWMYLPSSGGETGARGSFAPLDGPSFGPGEAANTWAPGEGTPFASVADVLLDSRPSSTLTAPKWTIRQWTKDSTIKWTSTAYVADSIAPCLRVIAPIGLIDNGDGTLSATFGWENLAPWNVTATNGAAWRAPNGGTTSSLGVNRISYAGTNTTPAGMPTTFGANSSGVWTYTFPSNGQDSAQPITWTVGEQSASFYVRPSLAWRVSAAPVGATPFTHVDFSTPQTAPVRAVSETFSGAVAAAPNAGTSGGAAGPTTLKVVNRLERPRRGSFKHGQLVHLSATIRNVGTADAINAQICDRIPNGMKFVSASGHRVKVKRNVLCWRTSRQAAGTAVKGVMTLRVVSAAKAGKRTNRVTVKATNARTTASSASFRIAG
jgi:uncharacterized repeat protein (TIGR01451 family)